MELLLSEAILALRPGSEFTIQNNDYSTIEWHVLEGDAPSIKEVEAKTAELEKLKAAEAAEKVTAKAALLERLGITEEEAHLLLA